MWALSPIPCAPVRVLAGVWAALRVVHTNAFHAERPGGGHSAISLLGATQSCTICLALTRQISIFYACCVRCLALRARCGSSARDAPHAAPRPEHHGGATGEGRTLDARIWDDQVSFLLKDSSFETTISLISPNPPFP